MSEEVRLERRGFWDIFVERYTSRKLLILMAASSILIFGLFGWIELTDKVFQLLNWWRGIAYVYMGVQAGVDAIGSFSEYRSYSYVPQTRTIGVVEEANSGVSDEEELLSP